MEGPELPPEGERNKFFPLVAPLPAPQTFEVGLILGGTVSAGAYTAGALDLFFQVLDRWYQQSGPLHDIKLTVAAGSSGGAVCAAIVAVLANHKFTHVTAPASTMVSPDQPITNLLWNTWVDGFSFDQLTTDMSDLDDLIDEKGDKPEDNKQHVLSILNCRMLDDAAADIACSANQPPDTVAPMDRQAVARRNHRRESARRSVLFRGHSSRPWVRRSRLRPAR